MPEASQSIRPIEGVLLLADLCSSISSHSRHGLTAFQAFRQPVREALISLEKATGFRLLEDPGDGFVLFRKHEPNASHEELITLFSEMQRKASALSTAQSSCALRYIAHFSAFHAETGDDGYPRHIQSTEAVRVFRAEKLANPGDLLITHELALRLHDAPERRGCKIETLRYDRPLKGLELLGAATTVFYRLRLPRHQDALDLRFPPLYRERRRLLREDCRTIPVFGRVFEAIDMDENFIQLRLDPVSRRLGKFDPESSEHHRRSEMRKAMRDRAAAPTGWGEENGGPEHDGYLSENARFTPAELDSCFRHGVILGLPGAGKTTILRYLTHNTLRRDATAPLLFAASGALTGGHTLLAPYDDGPCAYTVRGALRLLLSIFLWPAEELVKSADPAALEITTDLFHNAWQAYEATVLLDAVDESRSPELRGRLILAARALYHDLDHRRSLFDRDAPPSSRIFLTARRAFREELKLDDCLIFDVEPLDLGDLSQLARSVFDPVGKRQIADRFVAELPQQPASIRLGGTPMMALLLLFHFENLRGWASRYATYDTVIRFVLLKVWDKAKLHAGPATLDEFLSAASAADFARRFPEAGAIYDALSTTAWRALYGEDPAPLRRLTKQDILTFFEQWLTENPRRRTSATPSQTASEWFGLLRNAALFFEDGAGHFVFMHSTMLEYLAARWLSDRPAEIPAALAREQRQNLETFPMLCSRDWQEAHRLLHLLPEHAHAWRPDSTLAFSCLAETEDAELRALDQFNAEATRRPLRERINGGRGRDPIDKALADILWSPTPERLIDASARFLDLMPLKRAHFPARWSQHDLPNGHRETWFTSGLHRQEREGFLRTILHPELHQDWIFMPSATDLEQIGEIVPGNRLVRVSEYINKLAGMHDAAFMTDHARNLLSKMPGASPAAPLGLDLEGHNLDQNPSYYKTAYSSAVRGFLGSPNLRTNRRSDSLAGGFALSPNGEVLATEEGTDDIRLWDTMTGRELRSLHSYKGRIITCAWSPDNRRLVSVSENGNVCVWDTASGRMVRELKKQKGRAVSCAWSPDGGYIAVICAGQDKQVPAKGGIIRILDPDTKRILRSWSFDEGRLSACAWSPDSGYLAFGFGKTVRLWDPMTGRELTSLIGHSDYVENCAWSPDGRQIASVSHDRTVRVWNPETGRQFRSLSGHTGAVMSCAWSPHGRRLVSASMDRTLRVWDPDTGRELHSLSAHLNGVKVCVWSPDGARIISSSSDRSIRFWNPKTGGELRSLQGHMGRILTCAWSPDGKRLASGSDDGTIRLWDASSGRELRSIQGGAGCVRACSWSPDGRRLAAGSDDGAIRLWDADTGRELRSLQGHIGGILACAWSPNGKFLISGSTEVDFDESCLFLWDADSGRSLRSLSGHSDWIRACGWSPDGKSIASASSDRTVRLWDPGSGREFRTLQFHTGRILSCAWSPDSKKIVSASEDGTLSVCDVQSGAELQGLHGHKRSVRACAWSPDGKKIASASYDQTVRIWHPVSGKELKCFSVPSQAACLTFHPGNHLLAVGLSSGISIILDLESEDGKPSGMGA